MLLQDPVLLAAHRQMLPPGRRPGVDPLNVALLTGSARLAESDCLDAVWPTLSAAEKVAVLSNRPALDRLEAVALATNVQS
jgi:membrane glycosyltransferase